MTWKALGEAYYSIEFSGQQHEWMAALVRVLVAFGLFEEEDRVFQLCHVLVASNSYWQEDMMDQHLYGLTQQTENLLAKAIVSNHMEGFSTYTFQDLGKINCHIDDINNYSTHLKMNGGKNYYRGLAMFYKSMIQTNHVIRREYMELGVEFLRAAKNELKKNDIRQIHCVQMLEFLSDTNYFLDEMTDAFREYTLMQWSKPCADFWLRCTLLQMFNKRVTENYLMDSERMSGEAKTCYFQATLMQGYRCSIFEYLRKYYKPFKQLPIGEPMSFASSLQTEHIFNKGYFERMDCHSSKGYVHLNKHAEQAFKIGQAIANNPI